MIFSKVLSQKIVVEPVVCEFASFSYLRQPVNDGSIKAARPINKDICLFIFVIAIKVFVGAPTAEDTVGD